MRKFVSYFCFEVEVQSQIQQGRFSAYHKMAISPDEQYVALYLDSSVLLIANMGVTLTVSMQLDFSARAATLGGGIGECGGIGGQNQVVTLPSDMKWLDNSTVALQWRNFLVIADTGKNVYELFYPSFVHMQREVSVQAQFRY